MKTQMSNRRKPIIIFVVVLVLVLVATRITTSRHKDLKLANGDITGLLLLIFNENDKKYEQFLQRVEKKQSELLAAQEKWFLQLEKQNKLIMQQLELMRTPPLQLLLREKLIYLKPYDQKTKFPAYVWQTWKHGLNDDRFDSKYKESQAQWAFKNPGFVHELFNDDTTFATVKHLYSRVPEVIEAFEAMPETILRMNFFRYLILYAKGGVYADVDTYPLQPVPNWIPENVLPEEVGIILAVGSDTTLANWRQEVVRRLEFGNFVIQSKPGHPLLRDIIADITEYTLLLKQSLGEGEQLALEGTPSQKTLAILKWTGSGIWTDTVLNYLNDYIKLLIYQLVLWQDFHALEMPKLVSDILVLPMRLFASPIEVPKDGKVLDQIAFVKHFGANLWKSG